MKASKKSKQDVSIMGTNNSSIVSKRSVERLYFSEPHFFRYFVRKPQRRSPLINRGYWLRMYAVQHVVRDFLQQQPGKQKVVINLGCGYEPLPFQWLGKDPAICRNVKFIDVDHPELMAKKCEVISHNPQLADLVGELEISSNNRGVIARSEQYLAIGCDLRDLAWLDQALRKEIDITKSLVLITAEVSITYVDVESADALIAWSARFLNVRFCLVEQFLPVGDEHPFARTMIRHFHKLQTPLQNIHRYPKLEDQRQRFLGAGFQSVTALSLWDLWNDPRLLSLEDKLRLNEVEAFDEWEDFALFASHYFVLVASSELGPDRFNLGISSGAPNSCIGHLDTVSSSSNNQDCVGTEAPVDLTPFYQETPKQRGRRKYGVAFSITAGVIGHHGGLGPQSRNNSTDVYALETLAQYPEDVQSQTVDARMCHTATGISESDCLLAGGRASPDCAMADCWLRRGGSWVRVDDLPVPLYRHCATYTELSNGDQAVLVYGGKSSQGMVMDKWFLWRPACGWLELENHKSLGAPAFGATIAATGPSEGILLGGMAEDGTILHRIWRWSIDTISSHDQVSLKVVTLDAQIAAKIKNLICRFGACITRSSDALLLVGGIVSEGLLSQNQDIVSLSVWSSKITGVISIDAQAVPVRYDSNVPRPLMFGHAVASHQDSAAIFGGGAVCFSFGTYWNDGVWTLQINKKEDHLIWRFKTEDAPESQEDPQNMDHKSSLRSDAVPQQVSALSLHTASDFDRVLNQAHPVVISGLDLGPCAEKWSLEYLKSKVGSDRPVVVHDAKTQQMNFQDKNFSYVTRAFGEFIDQVAQGSKQYLRSLAAEEPANQPANFARDYPGLAEDFKLPEQLHTVSKNAHSSVLRISGLVTMWLHYDVMANVLCQIHGTKKILLYPPSDVTHLSIPPGASSSSINVFDSNAAAYPSLAHTHPFETVLHPGEILFIPALWLHTAAPTGSPSIAINVFFRNLKTGYAAGRDVYGNRDLQAYEKGRKDIAKLVQSFDGLPSDMRIFYLDRLVEELRDQARGRGRP